MRLLLVDLLILLLSVCSGSGSLSCPSNASITSSSSGCVRPHTDTRTAIYILVTVPFPDDREIAGWDYGIEMLPGGRIARDFINCNHSDLLPGYRLELIESNHEACNISPQIEAYINLIRYGLDQECGPVVAVAGLPCSSTTVGISPVAGRNDLIQLASAVSPVFEQDTHFSRYPRLWRYLSSARVYVDVVIELMSQLGWSSIGLIHGNGEYYSNSNLAETFRAALEQNNNFTRNFSVSVESTNPEQLNNAIQAIKDTGIRIIFCSTTFTQSTSLICRAANEGLVSPNYLWIFPDNIMSIEDFEEQIMGIDCTIETLYKGINRSLLLQYDIVNGAQIPGMLNYLDLYKQHLEEVQRDYNFSGREFISTGYSYSQLLFDQIWSFANALNQSLPQLHSMNISLKHNTVGNTPFADLLERALSQLNILGITGKISFNHLRVYPTSVRVVYLNIINSSIISGTIVGRYQNKTLVSFKLNRADVPRDSYDLIIETVPLMVIALMYLVILMVTVLTSIVLGLFYHNRKKPKVKASNPFLTVFMFVGCYLLCLAALLCITYGGFGGSTIRGTFYSILCSLELFLEQNGLNVILVTLFIKLLRVHHIFNTNKLRKVSSLWKNRSLAVIVLILCFIPNLLFIFLIVTFLIPTNATVYFRDQRDENGVLIVKALYTCNNPKSGFLYQLNYSPLAIYLIFIIYLSITMRKIKDTNFKDTKKVNIFVTIISLLSSTYIFSLRMLFVILPQYYQYVAVVQSLFLLTVVVACQVILLIPKITPSCCDKAVNSHQSRSYMLPWQFNTKLVGSFMPLSGEYQSQP